MKERLMRVVMFDDSVPFDGFTALNKPLGGAEKAFASLATALAKAGHSVTAVNRCKYAILADNVKWRSLNDDYPSEADLLIAFRNPELLSNVRRVDTRILWVSDEPGYLGSHKNAEILASLAPRLLFLSDRQAKAYGGRLSAVVAPSGVNKVFCSSEEKDGFYNDSNHQDISMDGLEGEGKEEKAPAPNVVFTTHPLNGLARMIDLWNKYIQPAQKEAKLTIFSSILAKGMEGSPVDKAIQSLIEKICNSEGSNIKVENPKGDRVMADHYSSSRLHWYPGHKRDFACWTLRESQAAGLPAIAYNLGGTEDIIEDSLTGFLPPDEEAFINVTKKLLLDDQLYMTMHKQALSSERRIPWSKTADIVAQLWL